MGLFSKKQKIEIQQPTEDLEGLEKMNSINVDINHAIEKSFSLNDFQTEHMNESGYFGSEFDLNSTAAKLKVAYAKEPWVFLSAKLIAQTLAGVEFKVRNKITKEEEPSHVLNDFISGGNANQDGFSLNWVGYLDLILGGNYFKAMVDGRPLHLPVELVELIPYGDKTDKRMLLTKGLIKEVKFYSRIQNTSITLPYEDIMHFKFPNPFSSTTGMSLFQAISRPILLDRYKGEYEMAFYLRGATNAGVIETTEDLTRTRMDRLMRTFEQAFTGKSNWWRTLFLPKGAKWVNSGLTMRDMEHLEGLRENRLTILAALGIPPSQVGIVQDVNRATAEEQAKVFWKNTIEPLTKFISAGYNNSYKVKQAYGGDVEVYADLSDVDALKDSLDTIIENVRKMDDIALINEQREMLNLPPLKETDPRGNMFVSEAKRAVIENYIDDMGVDITVDIPTVSVEIEAGDNDHSHVGEVTEEGNGFTVDEEQTGHIHELVGNLNSDLDIEITVSPAEDGHTHPNIIIQSQNSQDKALFLSSKKEVIDNQDNIERVQAAKYGATLQKSTDILIKQSQQAIVKGIDVREHLNMFKEERGAYYSEHSLPILSETMIRGFDMSNATTKSLNLELSIRQKSPRFSPQDEQAIEAIKRRTQSGRVKQLEERGIDNFYGFDETMTDRIERIVEDGLSQGQTAEQIAKEIETRYGEKYGDQAHTIARTETLVAISEGIKWQNDTLNEVFTKVNKQWLHVGDVATNEMARVQHAEFESLGEVPSDYQFENIETGGKMLYPRDIHAGAADIINCRCSQVSVIPKDAQSNASFFLE